MSAGPQLRDELISAGVIRPGSVDGLYALSSDFESVLSGIGRAFAPLSDAEFGTTVFMPPMMPREDFVRTDYLRSFPDLVGAIHTFTGGDREHAQLLGLLADGEDWSAALTPSEVVLCSAGCHATYAQHAGKTLTAPERYQIQGYCFRHEPSPDPARMQSFRMREVVCLGTAQQALAHRDGWLSKGRTFLEGLGLPVDVVPANDPFFGRAGRMLAVNQRTEALKYEIVCPVSSTEKLTAIASANYHQDHFGEPFEITADGQVAHSACFGLGLERITLALFAQHGVDLADWPQEVRAKLC